MKKQNNPAKEKPQNPKPYKRNWKKAILIYLATGAIIYAAVYYFVLSKQANEYSLNNPTSTTTETSHSTTIPTQIQTKTYPGTVKHFTDAGLEIEFNYFEEDNRPDSPLVVFKKNRKICLTYKFQGNIGSPEGRERDSECYGGQYVEVFSKKPSQTLKQAIDEQILKDYGNEECFAEESPHAKNEGSFTYAQISYPDPEDPQDFYLANASKCPGNYSKTNGLRYFMMDNSFPDKFAFFEIGQYAIPSDEKFTPWQKTFKFTR